MNRTATVHKLLQRTWLTRVPLLITLLIIIYLLPIWMFTYFPSQDGSVHLYNATIARDYNDPGTLFSDYFILNKELTPTWFGEAITTALVSVVPLLIVEKLTLSGYIILLPLSMLYALRSLRHDTGFLVCLVFLFIYNYTLHMGFYSFSYGLALSLVLVGYWLRHREQFTLGQTVGLTGLSLLLYGCHIVPLTMAYVAIAVLSVWLMLTDVTEQMRTGQVDRRALLRLLQSRVLIPLYAFLPTLILIAAFLMPRERMAYEALPLWTLLKLLFSLFSLVSFQGAELWIGRAFVGVFAVLCAYFLLMKIMRHQLNRWDGWLLVFLVYVVIFLAAPDTHLVSPNGMKGGGYILYRLNLYPFLALILWLGTQRYHVKLKRMIQGVAIGVGLLLLGFHTTKYAQLNDYLEEYLSGIHLIEPNTTLLPLSFSHSGHTSDGQPLSLYTKPFVHAASYITAQRQVVNLDNYQANMGYFPTLFRPNLNPNNHIGQLEDEPPAVDFLTYPERTGGRVDYVLVWGVRDKWSQHKDTKSIFRLREL